MSLFGLAFRSLREHRLRNALTILAAACSILAFVLLRTVVWAWNIGAEAAAPDRIATRHKVTFVMTLPKKYIDEIRNTEGVAASTFAVWSDGRSPAHDKEFFAALAVDSKTFFEVYDEISIDPAVKSAWLEDRKGAILGANLAKKLGWKVGDRVRLVSGIYAEPGEWEFEIKGLYTATRKSVDQNMFLWHFDYLNDSIPEGRRDQIGWIVTRVADPSKAAAITKTIDDRFDVRDVQTLTMSEGEMQKSFLGMFSAILTALDLVSLAILGIMALLVGNTIAMGVRDRTNQYAVMRAMGFMPKHLTITVLSEGLVLGALGGAIGLGIAILFINQVAGRFIEENMGQYFPYFRVTPAVAAIAFGLALALGAIAALLPARTAARLNIVEALRKVG
jgi:putative ABC transport system permease protein